MSRFIQPIRNSRSGLNDPRSTGAVKPLIRPEIQALRGTHKGKA